MLELQIWLCKVCLNINLRCQYFETTEITEDRRQTQTRYHEGRLSDCDACSSEAGRTNLTKTFPSVVAPQPPTGIQRSAQTLVTSCLPATYHLLGADTSLKRVVKFHFSFVPPTIRITFTTTSSKSTTYSGNLHDVVQRYPSPSRHCRASHS